MMIFNKNVSFPYPIFSDFSNDYKSGTFQLEVNDVLDRGSYYEFDIHFTLDNEFFRDLIDNHQAHIVGVIDGVDYYTFQMNELPLKILKNRIALNRKIRIQLMIVTIQNISFKNNDYLHEEYHTVKENIIVLSNHAIALSNVITYDGEIKKPYEIFSFEIKNDLDSEIKIEIKHDVINIVYKNNQLKYDDFSRKKQLNNHYVYMGLQKAILMMLKNYGGEEEEIIVEDLVDVFEELNKKLLQLMKVYKVTNVNYDNIDLVIFKISDHIISKHYKAIEEIEKYAG